MKKSQNGSTMIIVMILMLIVLLGLLNLSSASFQHMLASDLRGKNLKSKELAVIAADQALVALNNLANRTSAVGGWYYPVKQTDLSSLWANGATVTQGELTAKYIVYRLCDNSIGTITDISTQCIGSAAGGSGSIVQTQATNKEQLTGGGSDTAYLININVTGGKGYSAQYSLQVAP